MVALNVEIAQVGQVKVVTFSGDAGAGNAAAMELAVTRLCAARPSAVVIDLSRLTFIASLCMGSLVALRRSITSHGGTVRVAGANEQVALTLRRAKLDVIFPMDATLEESITTVSGTPA